MELRGLFAMQVAMMAAGYIATALFVPYLASLGYSQLEIVLYYLAAFASTIAVLCVARNWRMRDYLALGLGIRAVMWVLAPWLGQPALLWLVALMLGLFVTDFWVVFNTLFEGKTTPKNRAFLNGAVMAIAPAMAIVIPPLAGWVADNYGFTPLFAAGIVTMLPAIWLARRVGGERFRFDLPRAEPENKRIREVMFLEGFADGLVWFVPALVTLSFVSSNLEFGGFIAWLGLAGAASSLFVGKVSDRRGSRGRYLVPIMLVNGLSLVLAGIAGNLWVWALAMGLNSFMIQLEWPLTWAMVTESTNDVGGAMAARELWLNAGRISSASLAVALVVSGFGVQLSLVLGGVALWLFPVAMRLRKLG